MKIFKRREKTLHFLEVITEEDLANSRTYFKRKINETSFTTFKAFRHDCMEAAFVYLNLKDGKMRKGPGLYLVSVRIPFPSRYYYTKTKLIFPF